MAALIDALIARTSIPSASVCVRVDGAEVLHHTAGLARLEPPRPAVDEQIYDLASLTKILATTPIAAALAARGALDLDAPVAQWLPDVDLRIRVRHLLDHSSGLPAWRPLYEGVAVEDFGSAAVRERILQAARTAPVGTEPGTAHAYSDLGFLALMAVLERAGGRPFAQLFAEEVLDPRGLRPIVDGQPCALLRWGWPGAAATQACAVRDRVIEGEVDDLNCAALGGIAAHAGLFGSARTVCLAVDAMGAEIAAGGPLAAFAAHRGPGSHRLGFDSISAGYSSTGRYFPADTVGHLGFTGTSAWTSPQRRTTVVLLTNRVHPDDAREDIRAARPAVHDAVAEALGWG